MRLQAQPYRAGKGRAPSAALDAMKRGRDFQGGNSADITRAAQRMVHAAKKRSRRPPRPKRPQRPAR